MQEEDAKFVIKETLSLAIISTLDIMRKLHKKEDLQGCFALKAMVQTLESFQDNEEHLTTFAGMVKGLLEEQNRNEAQTSDSQHSKREPEIPPSRS